MKTKLRYLFLIFLCIFNLSAQNSYWSLSSEERTANQEKFERKTNPSNYLLYELNFSAFKQALIDAPLDLSFEPSNVIIDFPNPKGELKSYKIYEAPVMDEELAAKYPNSKSYVGKGISDPATTIRFSVTLFGLHVMSTSGKSGTFYIDTYTKDLNHYIVYARKSIFTPRAFTCFSDEEEVAERVMNTNQISSTLVNDGIFRQYRLAMACTIEYAAFHVNAAGLNSGTTAQKKAAVLAAMVVTMTRVNGIYERDMSLRMNLVANNDSVIFIDSDSFSNTNASQLINQSQTVIDQVIGFGNYDIGHTVSTGGGGLAGLGVVCTSSKARGITGSPVPVGDAYDVDYVAHEIGHQFGAPHTFSGTGGSCTGNASASNAFEPASGSTIMAYAGICTSNVQNNSDDYFHGMSINSMTNHVLNVATCSSNTNNGNFAPVVTVSNFTIPRSTPFVLTATATDANNDALTYCWEQINAGNGVNEPIDTQTAGPNFRSLDPVSSPSRYFPSLNTLINGGISTWEVLPSVARTLTFACTVRDNRTPNGGQTNRANATITVNNTGPFNVTSQNTTGISWAIGSNQTITWDVNNTNSITGASNVTILLSTDGGLTFPTVLVTSTPNDGSETIVTPNISATNCRIMVKPTGNVFFDINEENFSIGVTVTTVCQTYNATITTNTIAAQNPLAWVAFGTVTIPDNFVITDFNASVNLTHPRINDLYIGIVKPGSNQVDLVLYQQGCGTSFANMNTTFDDEGSALNCASISNSVNTIPLNPLSTFDGQSSQGVWRLAIADVVTANNGTLNSYSFNVCYQTATASIEGFGLANFNLFPNPNNGSFTVQFDGNSSEDVSINVHDIRGRHVYSKSYKNSGPFNKNIELNNVNSGIYLVTVTNGSSKEVKKIVIE